MSEIVNPELLPGGSEKDRLEVIIKNNGLTNCEVVVGAGSQKGDNYVGIITKFTVVGKNVTTGDQEQLNLILKSSTKNAALREYFPTGKLFEREITMYKTVLPLLKQLQISQGSEPVFDNYAKIYETSLEDNDEYLFMGDVKCEGFVMKDRKQTLDFEHCKIVLSQLGKYHACSYALKKHQPEMFKKYSDMLNNFMVDIINDTIRNHYETMLDKALQSLDLEKDALEYEQFQKFRREQGLHFIDMVWKGEIIDEYSIFTHGDCWSNNILYKYEDPTHPDQPTDVCFLDWQISHINSPVIDLSYFLCNCASDQLLKDHFDELIRIYYANLSECLRSMDCDPDELFPFEVLQDHLRKYFRYGLIMASNLIHLFICDSEEIPDIQEVKDLGEEELAKWNFESKNIGLYNQRVRGIIKHSVRKGYLDI